MISCVAVPDGIQGGDVIEVSPNPTTGATRLAFHPRARGPSTLKQPIISEWRLVFGCCFEFFAVLATVGNLVGKRAVADRTEPFDSATARAALKTLFERRYPGATLAQRAAVAALFSESGAAPELSAEVARATVITLVMEGTATELDPDDYEAERDAPPAKKVKTGEEDDDEFDDEDEFDDDARSFYGEYYHEVRDMDGDRQSVHEWAVKHFLGPMGEALAESLALPRVAFAGAPTPESPCGVACLARTARGSTMRPSGAIEDLSAAAAVGFAPDFFDVSADERAALAVFVRLFNASAIDADALAYADAAARKLLDESDDERVRSRLARRTPSHAPAAPAEAQWIHVSRVQHTGRAFDVAGEPL